MIQCYFIFSFGKEFTLSETYTFKFNLTFDALISLST